MSEYYSEGVKVIERSKDDPSLSLFSCKSPALVKENPDRGLFIKKDALAQVFSCEFCEISKNTFFTEHLWTTASIFTEHRWTISYVFNTLL